jgi:hypothetical protein
MCHRVQPGGEISKVLKVGQILCNSFLYRSIPTVFFNYTEAGWYVQLANMRCMHVCWYGYESEYAEYEDIKVFV